ncbi:hypothetical protein GUJ93_ZPchr0005g15761 [Zizania palustris]|uniref:Uncharacterized protein n=1 Tax=Zizania palustris TaxID=103762 RepID=A0A8J5SRT0_ZIZPA|nr:hypothetical protein GUJ93_ZPchr0005g15761 [Zizania palustris]
MHAAAAAHAVAGFQRADVVLHRGDPEQLHVRGINGAAHRPRDVFSISSNSSRALFLLSSRWSLSFSWAPAMSSLASVAGDVALSVTFFSCCSCAAAAVLPRDRFNHRK